MSKLVFIFYFHKKLYEHTTDLVHAVIPKADISEADDDTLDTTFECKSPPSDTRLGTAEYQANLDEDGMKPCHSRLYAIVSKTQQYHPQTFNKKINQFQYNLLLASLKT